jgi:hypothetical protein
MRTIDLKATVYAVIIALAVAFVLVPSVIHSGQASHRGAAGQAVTQNHRRTLADGLDNNPWD